MKVITFLAGACIGLAAVASAQTSHIETKVVTVDGEVVRYGPGNVIVIRGSDNKEVSYTLLPSVAVPAEVVGRRVTLYTEPGVGGATVSRVVSTSVTPEGKLKRTTEETRTNASGGVTKTQSTTINGEVVRYEGRTIVLRQPDSKVVTYTLPPSVTVPADVKVGQTVALYTEPGTGGAVTVSRIVSTSVTPDGKIKRTTEETRTTDSGATTRTTTTDISGRVEAYESGKTLTIVSSDGSKVTYRINGQSQVPADLAIGKTVTILVGGGPSEAVAQTVTYTVEK